MESALITWIETCLRNNITLDCETIQKKANKVYEYFSGNANNDSQDREAIERLWSYFRNIHKC